MRFFFTLILILFSVAIFAQKEQPDPTLSEEQKTRVSEVVYLWIEEMFKTENIDTLMQISDTPFALDHKKIIQTKEELKEIYLSVFEDKGKRAIPKIEIVNLNYVSIFVSRCIPVNAVKVDVLIEDDQLCFAVSVKDNEYKIIGFED